MKGCAVIVFARAPIAGQAKTRLAGGLGAAGAAALAERMLVHAVAQAAAAGCEGLELCVTPDGAAHPVFVELGRAHPALRITGQGEGDLGERMARALERTLRLHRAALLMGTDAPGLDAAMIRQAGAAVTAVEAVGAVTPVGAGHDAVFVPALDGGYALVGLARPAPELFAGMAWSTPQVMQHTRARAARAGLRIAELAPVADIDVPEDLVYLPPAWRRELGITVPGPVPVPNSNPNPNESIRENST
ncbi:MAG: TIGR04282 family arsenosugar biosynthesis glycosyltransferase [Burkholderiales bacterium]|nr:TIGR04282 family arsenosugar biosynthesis glycosyltransferase [Burkholderiales bacterium]